MHAKYLHGGLCDRRQSELEAKARDVRLQRALEEVERFRSLLQEQRAADKDNKDVSKSDFNRVLTGEPLCCLCMTSKVVRSLCKPVCIQCNMQDSQFRL